MMVPRSNHSSIFRQLFGRRRSRMAARGARAAATADAIGDLDVAAHGVRADST
jgi:hypothetical protein